MGNEYGDPAAFSADEQHDAYTKGLDRTRAQGMDNNPDGVGKKWGRAVVDATEATQVVFETAFPGGTVRVQLTPLADISGVNLYAFDANRAGFKAAFSATPGGDISASWAATIE